MLPQNHAIKSLLERRHAPNSQPHCLSLENMTSKQQQKIKSSIVDANNHLNRVFPFFDSLNRKFLPELRLIDIFSSYISFHQADHCSNESKTTYCNKLNELIFKSLSELSTVIVVLDTSIRNNVATSIAHIHFFNNPLKKTLHHVINITSTKAELFAIRCRINQVVQISGSSHIIVIMDALHAAQNFDSSVHPYQLQLITILKELRAFFNSHSDNSIEFWDCSSNKKWHLHVSVDKETKKFDLIPLYPSKTSWDFNKKECNNIIKEWHTTFKTLHLKGKNFLNLLNNNLSDIKPSYIKGGPWIKQFKLLEPSLIMLQ